MKTFFKFSIVLIVTIFISAGTSKADFAVENYPGIHHVVNGRYRPVNYPSGVVEYQAYRSDANITSETIRYNASLTRWELYLNKLVDGAIVRELAAKSGSSSLTTAPPTWGWSAHFPTAPTLVVPLIVYHTIDQYAACNRCDWGNPHTWSSYVVPRAYDNVIIDGNVVISTPAKCHNLTVRSGTASSPIRTLTGRESLSKLKIYGSLTMQTGTLLDLVELNFTGNDVQTLSMNVRNGSVMASSVRINTLKEVRLASEFRFIRLGTPRCVTTFMKGKVYLGSYDLTCQDIVDVDENKFIVTNGNGMLRFFARAAGEAMLHRFPVGPSAERYTPMMVLFATINREFSGMGAKAAYNPSIFLPDNHVNILYTVDHGTALPPSGTPLSWVYQLQWDADDATSSFNPNHPVYANKWNGTSWFETVGAGGVTGTGPYKFLFTARSAGVNNFGINAQIKRVVGERLSAEEVVQENSELDFKTFPNPATSAGFNVTVSNSESANLKLRNISGMDVPIKTLSESDNNIVVRPMQNLTSGIYLLEVMEDNKIRVHKVLVK